MIWLSAPVEYLAVKAVKKSHRPLLDRGDPAELFRQQLAVHEPLVRPLVSLVVDVATASDEEAADAIVALMDDQNLR